MPQTAKLAAHNLVGPSLDRLEGDRDDLTGNRVLRHAHGGNCKTVDHIFRGHVDDHIAVDGYMKLTQSGQVVFRSRIVRIKPERVRVTLQIDVTPAECAVGAWEMKVPAELLADGMDQDGALFIWNVIDPVRPERNGESNQKKGVDQHDRKLEVRRNAAGDAFVTRDRIALLPKSKEDENEKDPPSNKESAHEPMAELDDMIDLVALR